MRAIEAITAKGETSALCQSIGVSRASLYRRRRPTPPATAPNQVWSWDITKLKGPVPYLYYSLYVILDLFSRYVVGWMVAVKESAHLAVRRPQFSWTRIKGQSDVEGGGAWLGRGE